MSCDYLAVRPFRSARPPDRADALLRAGPSEGLRGTADSSAPVDTDRSKEIDATFLRVQRPLRWPLADYRRQKVTRVGFTGYVFSRVRGDAVAGFAHGFALRPDAIPGVEEAPEAVSYAFVRPEASGLYRDLVSKPRSPIRRLVAQSRSLDRPFEFHDVGEVVAVRHRPLARIPRDLFAFSAADFFMISQQSIVVGGFARRVAAATERRGP